LILAAQQQTWEQLACAYVQDISTAIDVAAASALSSPTCLCVLSQHPQDAYGHDSTAAALTLQNVMKLGHNKRAALPEPLAGTKIPVRSASTDAAAHQYAVLGI
jgi:hypothetical protein